MARIGAGRIANAAVFAVIGLSGVGVAAWGASVGVTCDGEPMRPAGRCLELSDGTASWRSYAEKQDDHEHQLLLLRGGGGLFLLAFAASVAFTVRRRGQEKRDAEEARAWAAVR